MIDLNFNEKLFNPLFFEIEKDLQNKDIRTIFCYGGSSAGKTYSIAQLVNIELLKRRNTAVLRKYSTDIKHTVYSDIKGIISKWDLNRFVTAQQNLVKLDELNYIAFRGLDDPEKVKGITNFHYIWMEEFNQFDFEDYKQIRKRLRGLENQKILATWNPVDEDSWVKKEVLDKETWIEQPTNCTGKWVNESGDMLLYKLTYKDNYWIVGSPDGSYGYVDKHVLNDFERDKINDFQYYQIYALGEWGRVDVGGEFYKCFDINTNTKKSYYDPNKPLHISFDENVLPYPALVICQGNESELWQIDEICLEYPKNRLTDVLQEFQRKYPMNKNGLFIYGDRTAKKEDTKLEAGQNFFTIIENALREYRPTLRLPSSNPPVKLRGNFINDTFRGLTTIKIFLHPDCNETIKDFKYLKENNEGTKLKEKTKHPSTKVSYEKYGHTSDCCEYLICEYFKDVFIRYQNKKEMPLIIW
jgi:phage terminase large subunit